MFLNNCIYYFLLLPHFKNDFEHNKSKIYQADRVEAKYLKKKYGKYMEYLLLKK